MAVAWLKDRASIIKATGNQLEKSAVKATSHLEVPPKEKHVRRIILTTYDSPEEAVFALRHLLERLASPDWVVVLKAITVFHRVFREGDEIAIEKVVPHPEVFGNLASFQDTKDTRAVAQSVFVRDYAGYMVEKLAVFQSLRYEFEKPALPGAAKTPTTVIKAMSSSRLLRVVPKLQRQLNMLFTVDPSPTILDNGATVFAFTLLIKDAFRLFHVINDAVLIIIDAFFDMKQSDALKAITLYQEYIKESDLVRDLMRKANNIPGLSLDLPSLKPASTGLLEALEEYVNNGNFEHTEAGDVRDVSELLGSTPLPDPVVGSAPPAPAPAPAPLISFGGPSLDPLGTPGRASAPAPAPASTASLFDVFDSVPFEQVLAKQTAGAPAHAVPPAAAPPPSSSSGGLLLIDADSSAYDQKQAEIKRIMAGGAGGKPAIPAGIFGGPPPAWAGAPAQTPAPVAAAPPALAPPLVPISAPGPTAPAPRAKSTNPFDFADLVDLSTK